MEKSCKTCKHYYGNRINCPCRMESNGVLTRWEPIEAVQTDNINHPGHYTSGKYEVIDIIESITNSMDLTPFQGYCLGNSLKYIARFKHKNGIEDLHKCQWYLDRMIKNMENEL